MNKFVSIKDVQSVLSKRGYRTHTSYINRNGQNNLMLILKQPGWTTNLAMDIEAFILSDPAADAEKIADTAEQMINAKETLEKRLSREFIEENIRTAIKESENETGYITTRNTRFEGIDEYLCIYAGAGKNEMFIPISDLMLKQYGITEDRAWENARKNNKKNAAILAADSMNLKDEKNVPVYILTNKEGQYGAVSALDKSFIRSTLSPVTRCRKWKVVFKSADQAYMIPDEGKGNEKAISTMLKITGQDETDPKRKMKYHEYSLLI